LHDTEKYRAFCSTWRYRIIHTDKIADSLQKALQNHLARHKVAVHYEKLLQNSFHRWALRNLLLNALRICCRTILHRRALRNLLPVALRKVSTNWLIQSTVLNSLPLLSFDGFGGNQWSPGGRWNSAQRLGGHMALMEMHPRNNKLCHDYLVRVVANMLHVSSSLLVPLVHMLD
jgi:hypothetical protein